jgi:hypothetical protein
VAVFAAHRQLDSNYADCRASLLIGARAERPRVYDGSLQCLGSWRHGRRQVTQNTAAEKKGLTELPNALNSSPHWPDFSTAKATSRRSLCRRSPADKSLVGIAGTDVQKPVAGFAREHDGPQTQEANTHFVKFLDSVLACSSPHQSC